LNARQRRKAARNTRPAQELVAKLLLMDAHVVRGSGRSHLFLVEVRSYDGEAIYDPRDHQEWRIIRIDHATGGITQFYHHETMEMLRTHGQADARYVLLTNAMKMDVTRVYR